MKRIFRSPRRLFAVSVILLTLHTMASAQEIGKGTPRQADRLLETAIAGLERSPALTAKIRQRVETQGESLVGSGSYQQANYGQDCLFRLDLKMPLGADQVSTLLQVGDGRYLWSYRLVPDLGGEPDPAGSDPRTEMPMSAEVTLIDLNQVRGSGQLPGVSAFGGLPHMLRQIAKRYQMQTVTPGRLQELEIWTLQGRLREPDTTPADSHESNTKPGMLEYVFLLVGQDDGFPYRIEYRDRLPGEQSNSDAIIVSALERQSVAMDFFEVQHGAQIDPRAFDFKPPDGQIKDVTDQYLDDSAR